MEHIVFLVKTNIEPYAKETFCEIISWSAHCFVNEMQDVDLSIICFVTQKWLSHVMISGPCLRWKWHLIWVNWSLWEGNITHLSLHFLFLSLCFLKWPFLVRFLPHSFPFYIFSGIRNSVFFYCKSLTSHHLPQFTQKMVI